MKTREFRAEMQTLPRDLDLPRIREFRDAAGPLDLEIGCGVGWHPIQYAAAHADRRLIALERTADKFAKFRARHARHPQLTHLLPVHADAVPFVAHAFPEPGPWLQRVFLLYPNPYPKNPAQRWVRMPFFGFLLDRVAPGGEVIIASNERSYLEEVREFGPRWSTADRPLSISAIREVAQSLAPPRTHFEKKYLERGEACGEISLRRST